MNYCNKTDLQNVYSNIEDFHRLEQLEDFTASGDNYLKRDTGKIVLVLEDDTELTEATDDNLDTGEWYYDGTNDILYVRCSDDGDPATHTIQFNSTTWDDLTDYAIAAGAQQLESMLSRAGFQRPIPKSSLDMDFNSTGWDADIVRANALLACAIIIDRKEPESELADRLYRRVWDSENSTGLIWNYVNGNFRFSFEPTKQDFVGQIIPVSESTTGRIYLSGYGASYNYTLRVKITTAGAVETARFDVSYDDGTSYETTGIYTQYYYQLLFENIYIRFEGTFTEGEEWQIKVRPESEEMRSSINNIVIQRN